MHPNHSSHWTCLTGKQRPVMLSCAVIFFSCFKKMPPANWSGRSRCVPFQGVFKQPMQPLLRPEKSSWSLWLQAMGSASINGDPPKKHFLPSYLTPICQMDEKVHPLCDGHGSECFYTQMLNTSVYVGCSCLPDCEQRVLSIVKNTFLFDKKVPQWSSRLFCCYRDDLPFRPCVKNS